MTLENTAYYYHGNIDNNYKGEFIIAHKPNLCIEGIYSLSCPS